MSDWPTPDRSWTPLHVATITTDAACRDATARVGGLAAAVLTWVANLAVFVPVRIPWRYPVKRVWWVNGSTITTTNVDFGIYANDGAGGVTRVYSTGSTAMAGASTRQYVTPANDFILEPDLYYFAWTCSGTTSRGYGTASVTANAGRLSGMFQQATALPLPATATPAALSNALYPLCGITRTASGF